MFKIDDKVKIRKSNNWIHWYPIMDSNVGMIGRIMNIREYNGELIYLIRFDGEVDLKRNHWEYNSDCLINLNREEKLKRILNI